jgi:hypothetical protein
VRGEDFKSVGGLSPQLFDSAFVVVPKLIFRTYYELPSLFLALFSFSLTEPCFPITEH